MYPINICCAGFCVCRTCAAGVALLRVRTTEPRVTPLLEPTTVTVSMLEYTGVMKKEAMLMVVCAAPQFVSVQTDSSNKSEG